MKNPLIKRTFAALLVLAAVAGGFSEAAQADNGRRHHRSDNDHHHHRPAYKPRSYVNYYYTPYYYTSWEPVSYYEGPVVYQYVPPRRVYVPTTSFNFVFR